MKVKFSPVRTDVLVTGMISGDVITLNDASLDLSPLGEGATLPHGAIDSDFIVGDVERHEGDIHITLLCPHGANAPYETRFPSAEYIDVEGEIPFPAYNETEAQ